MNTKYAVALILALQVSMSLCEAPPPSAEMVARYEELRTTFIRRLMAAYGRMRAAIDPMMQSENGETVRGFVEQVQAKPEFQAAVKVAGGAAEAASPVIDRARASLLGLYEHNLRGDYGAHLSSFIDRMKVFLDTYLPAE